MAIEVEEMISVMYLQVNIYMGLALLSMPYAMKEAGWLGAVALACACALFCLSAKLLTAGFKSLPAGVAQTYPNLGKGLTA